MTVIKAIETRYAGRLFRSRLEARWAVFYDALGVPWSYEDEGYELSDGAWYLPDFYLPSLDVHIEIKPASPTELESSKMRMLAQGTGKRGFIFYGQPSIGGRWGSTDSDSAHLLDPNGYEDYGYAWCRCAVCGRFGIEFSGEAERICRAHPDRQEPNPNHPLIVAACAAANAARF